MRVLMPPWRNWSGSVICTPAEIHRPTLLDDIVTLVRRCGREGKTIRVVGSGHSFSPLVATDCVMLSLENYAGLESVDAPNCTATVKAGTTLRALGELLFAHGLAQENLGDIDEQTIAGAIGTGTHGTGVGFGSIATQVTALTLVTGTGDVVTCSESENRDLFKAAQVSLGALGIVVGVTLRLVPAYALRIDVRKKTLTDCLANLETYTRDNRHFEFHFLPYTDIVQAKFTNLTDETPGGKSFGRWFNEYALENGALWLFSAFNRQFPGMSERVCKAMAAFVADTSGVSHAHRVFATARLVRFQEMEYNLPAEDFEVALREVDAMIRREKIQVHIPVECRFVRGDDIPLSPAYGRDSAYIAVHMFRGMPYQRYFDRAEEIFMHYGGRPHWGKVHTRRAADLAPLYPAWAAFQTQRDLCDPHRIFMSPYLAALVGP
jgi:FAD-linked oxidoreductase